MLIVNCGNATEEFCVVQIPASVHRRAHLCTPCGLTSGPNQGCVRLCATFLARQVHIHVLERFRQLMSFSITSANYKPISQVGKFPSLVPTLPPVCAAMNYITARTGGSLETRLEVPYSLEPQVTSLPDDYQTAHQASTMLSGVCRQQCWHSIMGPNPSLIPRPPPKSFYSLWSCEIDSGGLILVTGVGFLCVVCVM